MKKYIGIVLAGMSVFCLVGCEVRISDATQSSFKKESVVNESTQQRLSSQIPAPTLQTSLERKNLVRRANWVNRENAQSYIYLISYGKVIKYFNVDGKVSSLNSYLTAMERVEKLDRGGVDYAPTFVVLEAPDLDGSYGKNPDGIFFWTTEGAYVEWKGEYLWSSQPLFLDPTEPQLYKEVK